MPGPTIRTTLRQLLAFLHDDATTGTDWTIPATGEDLTEALACHARDIRHEPDRYHSADAPTRYTLSDGTIVTTAGTAWDFGYFGCMCWRGAGHVDDCEGSRHYRCQCGAITGTRCGFIGPASSFAVIQHTPEAHRASHTAARNRGTWPTNGDMRLAVSHGCLVALAEAPDADARDWNGTPWDIVRPGLDPSRCFDEEDEL